MARRHATALDRDALACPRCEARYPGGERFCGRCGLPLVRAEGPPVLLEADSPRHALARKVKPQLSEGRLVAVVQVRSQVEGEFVQSMLLEEGVPSLLRRSAGFDVPDFLAAGPRDVLVPASGLDVARDVLRDAELLDADPASQSRGRAPLVRPGWLLAGLLAGLAFGALVVWLLLLIVR
jgi:hypothetical protein